MYWKKIGKKTAAFVMAFVFILQVADLSRLQVWATDYSSYSSSARGWGIGQKKDHTTPSVSKPSSDFSFQKYDAYYVGDTTRKVAYLTFDCGYENGNTAGILDVLKKNDIKVIFFVTKHFVKTNPQLVIRMKKEGHLVGNHTANHKNLPACSVDKVKEEVKTLEEVMKQCTGYDVDPYIRPPEGSYSVRTLKILQDMGYKTFFWSMAWADWDPQNQPSVDFVINRFQTYYHNGMIPLIHNTSKADLQALPKIIQNMKSLGFEFERVDDIFKKTPKLTVVVKDKVYNGQKIDVKIKTKSDGKQIVRYYDNHKKRIKKPSDAGVYYVEVIIKASDTYKEVRAKQKFRIQKATAPVTVRMPRDIHEGDAYEPLVFTKNKDGKQEAIYCDESGKRMKKPVKAGNYQVRVKVAATDNYKSASSVYVQFTIQGENI